jgi:hypothetical protein
MATALQLVQQAMLELGLPSPSVVVGSNDDQVKQFLALLNASGYELCRQHQWEALNKQYIVTTSSTTLVGNTTAGSSTVSGIASTAGIDTTYQISGTGINQATFVSAVPSGVTLTLSQPATSTATGTTFTLGKVRYSMPSDYDRKIDRTDWDKTKHWEMLGPETAQQWEWLLSGYISTGPRIRFRIFGGYFQIWPMVTTADTLGFEYVSNAWAASTGGTAQSSILADTDTTIFPDRLMVLSLKRKFWQIKGFDTSSLDTDFAMELSISKANDAGSKTLSMAPALSTVLINWDQIPDSGYGS